MAITPWASGELKNSLNYAYATSQYSAANFTNQNWQYRLVAAGIKVQYAGALLYRSGTYTTWRNLDNNNANIVGTNNVGDLLQYMDACAFGNVNGSMVGATFRPAQEEHLDYQPMTFWQVNGGPIGPSNNGPQVTNAIIVQGCVNQPYTFEGSFYFELTGQALHATKSDSDPEGMAKVAQSAKSLPPHPSPESDERSILKDLKKSMSKIDLRDVAKLGAAAAREYASRRRPQQNRIELR